MSETLTERQLKDVLKAKAKQTSQRKVAAELRVSPAFMCDVLKGRRVVTERLARKLGYKRIVRFERVGI